MHACPHRVAPRLSLGQAAVACKTAYFALPIASKCFAGQQGRCFGPDCPTIDPCNEPAGRVFGGQRPPTGSCNIGGARARALRKNGQVRSAKRTRTRASPRDVWMQAVHEPGMLCVGVQTFKVGSSTVFAAPCMLGVPFARQVHQNRIGTPNPIGTSETATAYGSAGGSFIFMKLYALSISCDPLQPLLHGVGQKCEENPPPRHILG